MERRFAVRLDELRRDARVDPQILAELLPRLRRFVEPFAAHLRRSEQREHAQTYVAGLLSNLPAKNAEAIAYLHDQERKGLQKFLGQSRWDHRPLLTELAQQVGAELGEPDAVLVFDPSAFPKKGTESVGVQRQWCGRLGKVDNCQVGVYLGYVARREHALVDVQLFLPRSWAGAKKRRKKVGVPREVQFQTRHELCLAMLDEKGPLLPHAWISGDDEMGRSTGFREALQQRQERYLLAVPSNTTVRDLTAAAPPYAGRGRHPQVPFQSVKRWAAALPEAAWTRIDVRDGDKGPLVVEGATVRVLAKTSANAEEVLVVFRERQRDGSWKHDYLLSNAPADTPLSEFARVFKAQHRIEECLQRAKGEAGLGDYEVRTWQGWYHHQALSLLATWFLTQEAQGGKKVDARADGAAAARGPRPAAGSQVSADWRGSHVPILGAPEPTHGRSPLLAVQEH
jgi:SRSO17 transposase